MLDTLFYWTGAAIWAALAAAAAGLLLFLLWQYLLITWTIWRSFAEAERRWPGQAIDPLFKADGPAWKWRLLGSIAAHPIRMVYENMGTTLQHPLLTIDFTERTPKVRFKSLAVEPPPA